MLSRARCVLPLLGSSSRQCMAERAMCRRMTGVVAGQDTPLSADKVPGQVKKEGDVVQAPGKAATAQQAQQAQQQQQSGDYDYEISPEQAEREAREEITREKALSADSGWIGYGSDQAPIPPDADIYSGGPPQAGDQATTSKEQEGVRDVKGGD